MSAPARKLSGLADRDDGINVVGVLDVLDDLNQIHRRVPGDSVLNASPSRSMRPVATPSESTSNWKWVSLRSVLWSR